MARFPTRCWGRTPSSWFSPAEWLGAGVTEDTTFLDVLVVVTLLSFAGTITVARYVERVSTSMNGGLAWH